MERHGTPAASATIQSSGKAQTLAPSASDPQTKQCVHINTHICQLLLLPVCGGVKSVNTPASRMNAGPSAREPRSIKFTKKGGGPEEYKSSARSSPVVIAPGSRNGGIAKQECGRCTTLKQIAALLLFEPDSVATAAAPRGSAPGYARAGCGRAALQVGVCVAGVCKRRWGAVTQATGHTPCDAHAFCIPLCVPHIRSESRTESL